MASTSMLAVGLGIENRLNRDDQIATKNAKIAAQDIEIRNLKEQVAQQNQVQTQPSSISQKFMSLFKR